MEPLEFRIPATDLTFEWSNCKACFWAKHRLKWKKPYTPFPSVFNKIDGAMRGYWEGRSSWDLLGVMSRPPTDSDEDILAAQFQAFMPDVVLQTKAKKLLSKAIAFNVEVQLTREVEYFYRGAHGEPIPKTFAIAAEAYTQPVHIRVSGSIDMMGHDGQQGLVVDAKTSSGMTLEKAKFYAPQLQVYKHALENPEKGDPLPNINHLGLIVLEPTGMSGRNELTVKQAYFPLPTEGLMPLLNEVANLLAGPEPANDKCPWCEIRHVK